VSNPLQAIAEDRTAWGRLLGAGIWLVFLGNPLGVLLDRDDWRGGVGVVALAIFAVIYLIGLARIRIAHMEQRYLTSAMFLTALFVLAGVVIAGAGDQGLTCLVFISALAVASLPSWHGVAVAGALFLVAAVGGRMVDDWSPHGNDFAILLATGAVFSFRLAWQRQGQLMHAEEQLTELAVEEERSRIARDLHDILGHSLTVVSVKAELAERLLDSDPEGARRELADLRRLTRDALADVRSTAQGIRGVSLAGEIAAARTALESAGIEPHLPTTVDEVPSQWRELFAWTIREGVTNVIRHSGATRCDIEIGPTEVTVTDDGRGVTGRGTGSGLEGLRQRARSTGSATVVTGAGPGGSGFRLSVVAS